MGRMRGNDIIGVYNSQGMLKKVQNFMVLINKQEMVKFFKSSERRECWGCEPVEEELMEPERSEERR